MLSFTRAVEVALQFERADEEMNEYSASVQPVLTCSHTQATHLSWKESSCSKTEDSHRSLSSHASISRASQHSRSQSPHCFCCGSQNHNALLSRCPTLGQRCLFCHHKSHFQCVWNKKLFAQGQVHELELSDAPSLPEGAQQVLAIYIPHARWSTLVCELLMSGS